MKILHFSPVKKENEIVKLHLQSLNDIYNSNQYTITFSFFDDNIDEKSSVLLNDFVKNNHNSFFFTKDQIQIKNSEQSKERWEKSLYERITMIKDYVIDYFVNSDYDYLFLTDSDLIIHPKTIENLISQNKDFCSEIFWTHFDKGITYTPNCWYSKPFGFNQSDLIKFSQKGTYEVDFTGACTLLTKNILKQGVRFEKISNVSFLGEDKHFCIRAAVLDFKIYINTDSPAFHLYNLDLLSQGENFIKNGYSLEYLNNWLDDKWKKDILKIGVKTKVSWLKRIKNAVKILMNY